MKKYFLLFFIVLLGQLTMAQECNIKRAARYLMGKTISQAIMYLNIDTTKFHLVQEPPMVLRGIGGGSKCFHFYLYTEREMIPVEVDTTGGKWRSYRSRSDYDRIKDKKIIGLYLQRGKYSIEKGETIVYYD